MPLGLAVEKMWPTPTARDGPSGPGHSGQGGLNLRTAVDRAFWPTPTASDADSSGSRNLPGSRAHAGVSLTDAVTSGNSSTPRWFTPTARDYKDRGTNTDYDKVENGRKLAGQVGGQLNPTWVEWLMGFPLGWTDLEPSATPSSPRLPSGSDDESSR